MIKDERPTSNIKHRTSNGCWAEGVGIMEGFELIEMKGW